MILAGAKAADVLSTGSEDSIDMSIDTADQGVLMMILSESLYKDPVGSLIREWTSNALDAHTEAGINEPITVSLSQDAQYNWWFKVKDVGTGMSPDRILNVVSKYAASTKRMSDKYLGAFGLGLKSGLAYSDSFTIVTRWEGTEYTYVMYKGEDGTKIDLMRDTATPEGNGTTVQIQLKSSYDRMAFTDKIREQLCYFEGVIFDVPGVSNTFTILKNADWKFSSMNTSSKIHIVLNNVFYAIDWARLGIEAVNVPIGLAFEVGEGLIPTPSREDIKYTQEAKELIKIRLAGLADYVITKHNESVEEKEYWGDIYHLFNNEYFRLILPEQIVITLKLKELEPYSYLKPTLPSLKSVKLLDLKYLSERTKYMFSNYEMRGKILHNRNFYGKYSDTPTDLIQINRKLIFTDHKPKGLELEYIKNYVGECVFLYKTREKKLGALWNGWRSASNDTYITLLNLKKYPRSQWRGIIKEYQGIEASVIEKIPNIRDLQPTPEWLEERRANRAKGKRRAILEGDILLREGRAAIRGENNMVFELVSKPLKTLPKTPGLTIYGKKDQQEYLDGALPLTTKYGKKMSHIHLAIISKPDIKKVQGIHNFTSIEEFMRGDNKPFKRIATAALIGQLMADHVNVFDRVGFINQLSADFSEKLHKLEEYHTLHDRAFDADDDIMKAIMETAGEYNLWDYEVYDLIQEVIFKIDTFDFISSLDRNRMEDGSALEVAKEILRGRKFKMNWQNYPGAEPVDQVVEDVLEEIKAPF